MKEDIFILKNKNELLYKQIMFLQEQLAKCNQDIQPKIYKNSSLNLKVINKDILLLRIIIFLLLQKDIISNCNILDQVKIWLRSLRKNIPELNLEDKILNKIKEVELKEDHSQYNHTDLGEKNKANYFTTLGKKIEKKDIFACCNLAILAWIIDPKPYRLKWLIFKLHKGKFDFTAKLLLPFMPADLALSESECKAIDEISQNKFLKEIYDIAHANNDSEIINSDFHLTAQQIKIESLTNKIKILSNKLHEYENQIKLEEALVYNQINKYMLDGKIDLFTNFHENNIINKNYMLFLIKNLEENQYDIIYKFGLDENIIPLTKYISLRRKRYLFLFNDRQTKKDDYDNYVYINLIECRNIFKNITDNDFTNEQKIILEKFNNLANILVLLGKRSKDDKETINEIFKIILKSHKNCHICFIFENNDISEFTKELNFICNFTGISFRIKQNLCNLPICLLELNN